MDGFGDTLTYRTAAASHFDAASVGASTSRPIDPPLQRTLAAPIGCVGVGLHSGRPVALDLHPAEPGTGIVFTRTDIDGAGPGQRHGRPLHAHHDMVVDTRLCTMIGAGETTIGTIEHLMAALAGQGIDNARVTLDGPELPILDGSAEPFVFLLDCAGVAVHAAPRRVIEILRPVRVTSGAARAELLPHAPGDAGLHLHASIDFFAPAIGRQSFALWLSPDSFRHDLAAARTFTDLAEIDTLRAAGLARGGSLDNALVVDGARVLNPGGLRMADEFVRHKLLDAVGDLALAGAAISGRFIAHRGGHALNNRLLRALFADPAAYRLTTPAAALLSAA